eukprot:CAMPEP_0119302930 /NCGR_PEP_ID=MMETSP1333-20130426/4451_1 /TAXON_ID=418940 /ORGANISM="Scyphosphaera apsteinii, Strain RCC1455" /LENGTH=230 /DNA_ID=CAMNT_0007305455 /DNA_START=26 /DNA_END=718 /DNA_ORIENTATION=+
MSKFQALETKPEDLRETHEVFGNVAVKPDDAFKNRFASSGRFTSAQLESGAEAQPSNDPTLPDDTEADDEEPEFDPNDTRTLYDRLKEQRDAKQEAWEEKNKFKNQMDHWRLDEDDAAWEDERLHKLKQQQAESLRQREEGTQFYKLARAVQERSAESLPTAASTVWSSHAAVEVKRKRQAAALPISAIKVVKQKQDDRLASMASGSTERESGGGALPGMDAYSDDSEDD